MEKGNKPAELGLERKGCDATEDKAGDEDSEPEANATKMIGLRHGRKKSSELWARTSRWLLSKNSRIRAALNEAITGRYPSIPSRNLARLSVLRQNGAPCG